MKKVILASCAFILFSIGAMAQKVSKLEGTSSANVQTVLEAMQTAGKQGGYGNRDLDMETGKVTLWKNIGDRGLVILIDVTVTEEENGSRFKMACPHLAGNLDNYKKRIEKAAKFLVLPDLKLGEYITEID